MHVPIKKLIAINRKLFFEICILNTHFDLLLKISDLTINKMFCKYN